MADKKEEKKEPEVKLTKDELILLQNLLFNSRFTGQEWEQVIKPLINKLALLVDLENKK